jgi:hypothetical protein
VVVVVTGTVVEAVEVLVVVVARTGLLDIWIYPVR